MTISVSILTELTPVMMPKPAPTPRSLILSYARVSSHLFSRIIITVIRSGVRGGGGEDKHEY